MTTGLRIKGLVSRHVGPVDLELALGECLALSGPSGAGKTLLLRAIADLDRHQGEIWLGDTLYSAMSAHEWRHKVGLLAAESQWWGDTVGEHFDTVDESNLLALGFSPDVMHWQVANCSTGERQRLALLRLLQNEPEVLLLDEPTASLDTENVVRVEQLLETLCKDRGLALLWVSHDNAQLNRVAMRHLQLVEGRLMEVSR